MKRDISRLSGRERQVLELIARSHDAKSVARSLNLSVHTVNELLRASRQKLGVSSSKEAARLLIAQGEESPKIPGDEQIGVGDARSRRAKSLQPGMRALLAIAGACFMIVSTLLALTLSQARHDAALVPPKATALTPANGSTIAPGPFLMSVTFDQPMGEGYSFVQVATDSFPNCEHRVDISPDHRTFTMHCIAEIGKRYEVWFNRPPYMNFRTQSGISAQPQQLRFSVQKR